MKKHTLNSFIASLLAILMAAAAFSCAGESGNGAVQTDSGTSGESTAAETETYISDGLPEEDYEGYDFTLYLRSFEALQKDFAITEESGDIVEDAVYKRNLSVAERFNINIIFNYDDSQEATYNTTAVQAILAGEDVNDVLALHGAFAFQHAKQGYLLDWIESLEYCDLEKPWWDADFAQNLAIAGRLFAMSGDISYLSVGSTFCLIFNKDMLDAVNTEYPYQSVKDGTWTFDELVSLSKLVSSDSNGDGSITPDMDTYGMATGSWNYPVSMFYMAGDRVITINSDGTPSLTVYSERTVDIIDKFMAYIDSANVFIDALSPAYTGDIFKEGRALFSGAGIGSLQGMRSFDMGLGIIPCPKYDEQTENYYSLVDAGASVFAVPVTSSDPERTSVILEALAAEGYRSVVPTFFEDALKLKYSRDDESVEMLELIRKTRFFDYGYFDATVSWDLSYIGRNAVLAGGDLTSYYKARESGALTNLELLYEQYTK